MIAYIVDKLREARVVDDAGALVALYIIFEAPLSGMSMNPARTVASALPAHVWTDAWIYFLAPPLGMLSGWSITRTCRRASS